MDLLSPHFIDGLHLPQLLLCSTMACTFVFWWWMHHDPSCVFHTQCNIIFIYKVFPLGHKTDHLWPCKVMIMYWLTFYIHMYLQAWELYVLRRHWICYNCMLLWTTLSGAAIVTMLMYCVSGVRTDPLVSWQSIQYM